MPTKKRLRASRGSRQVLTRIKPDDRFSRFYIHDRGHHRKADGTRRPRMKSLLLSTGIVVATATGALAGDLSSSQAG
ncbi:MAG: hypothetical protein WBE01_11835, partial [Methyloceanibacter sp.]